MNEVFMRGNSYSLDDFFYVVGEVGGVYYYLVMNTTDNNLSKTLMVSMTYDNLKKSGAEFCKVFLQYYNGKYTMKGSSTLLPMSTNDNNTLDINASKPADQLTLIANNAFDGNADNLYAGVYYTLFANDNIVKWNSMACTSSIPPFCNSSVNTAVDVKSMNIMLIPQNLDADNDLSNLTFWNGSSCQLYRGNTTVGLQYFQWFITKDKIYGSVGCSGVNTNYLSSESKYCYFTDVIACESKYLYQVGGTCGLSLGTCQLTADTMPSCNYSSKENKMQCTQPDSDNSDYMLYIYIFIISIVVILIIVAIVLIYKHYSKKNKKQNSSTNPN